MKNVGHSFPLTYKPAAKAGLVDSNDPLHRETVSPSSPKQASRTGNPHLGMSILIVEQLL